MIPSRFAPAVIQSFASSRMELRRIGGGALLRRNTLAFHSFQMVHLVQSTFAQVLYICGGTCKPPTQVLYICTIDSDVPAIYSLRSKLLAVVLVQSTTLSLGEMTGRSQESAGNIQTKYCY